MRLSKGQATVIVLLNVFIAALVAVILFAPDWGRNVTSGLTNGTGGGNNIEAEDPPQETVHNKYRNASVGQAEEISRETRIMGTGDETVIAVFERNGVLFIFGNATVADLDFDSYGGFLCLVNSSGTIIKYTYFNGNITAVGIMGNGYAVAVGKSQDSAAKLYFIDYSGDATGVAEPDGDVIDIFAVDNSKAGVVTQPTSSSLRFAEYSIGQDVWTLGRSTRIESGYTLKYFDCYDFGGSYVIAARAYSLPRYDSAVFYSFTVGGDATAHYYGGSNENITRPYAVMPCSSGYLIAASKNGVATFIKVGYEFMSDSSVSLGFVMTDARLFYCGGKYYVCFDRADGAITFETDGSLSRTTLTSLDGIFIDSVSDSGNIVVTGVTATTVGASREYNSACIAVLYSGKIIDLPIENCVFYGAFKNADEYVFVLSATGGEALSEPSGGRDIYIISVKTA